jgi:SAM-dependent methyltransferase
MGCGTGENLTIPLAERFPEIRFMAVDTDTSSIEYAMDTCALPNLKFGYPQDLNLDDHFDLIIASEVIEHVDDPLRFLIDLGKRLTGWGYILLTLPNGYGPFELASLADVLLQLTGIRSIVQRIKRLLGFKQNKPVDNPGTLAISPHINFFSFRGIKKLISAGGFSIEHFRPRTFLCGYRLDRLVEKPAFLEWNARIADTLPAMAVSDWMFVLKKSDDTSFTVAYRRGLYAKTRKYLNEKYWKLR